MANTTGQTAAVRKIGHLTSSGSPLSQPTPCATDFARYVLIRTAITSTAKVTTARMSGHGRDDAALGALTADAPDPACDSPTSSASIPPSLQLPSCVRLEVSSDSSASSTTFL